MLSSTSSRKTNDINNQDVDGNDLNAHYGSCGSTSLEQTNDFDVDDSKFCLQDILIGVEVFLVAQQLQDILIFCRHYLQNMEQEEYQHCWSDILRLVVQRVGGNMRNMLKVIELDFTSQEEEIFVQQMLEQGQQRRELFLFVVLYFFKRQKMREAVLYYDELLSMDDDIMQNGGDVAFMLKEITNGIKNLVC
eukprot:TRINITY_DN37215_c0_g1_i1.p3 TRINITY_DN37215_c0_g1~~TRINITY_DN37215_c0_g1_i1.p3  ORF type:complete len:222 (-),score=16.99 TRINITY_DN37215_c0_g1_i1:173-748(-)